MSSIPRFFVPEAAIRDQSVMLPAEAAHHAADVLRLRVEEAITVHDGTGAGYRCRLTTVGRKSVIAAIVDRFIVTTEPDTRLTVAQALPKTSEKIDQVLQHGTEVGAAGFVVFPAERSVARLDKDRLEKRTERWRGIVQGAAEQSGRGILPTVNWSPSIADILRLISEYDAVLLFHESATGSLREALALPDLKDKVRFLLLVGPEGGFSDNEVAAFTKVGARAVSLGPRVLRTETAALVALSQILYDREK